MDHTITLQPGIFLTQMSRMLGGLFVLLLGAAILYTNANWWLHGERIVGMILGVRRRGARQFHNVYQYVLPNGDLGEATSVQGGGSLKGRDTGRHVAIRILPGQPEETREAPGLLLWGLALGVFLTGAWIMYDAAIYRKRSAATWIVLALVASFVGRTVWRWMMRSLEKIEPKLGADDPWSAFPIEAAETLSLTPQASRIQVRSRNPARSGAIFCVVGLIILGTGWFPLRHLLQFKSKTDGTVFRLHSRWSRNEWVVYPEVQFTDTDRSVVRFLDQADLTRSHYAVGDHVKVLYQPGKPDTAMIDRGLRNWEPLFVVLILGGVMTGLGAFTLRSLFGSVDAGRVGKAYDA